MILNLESFFLQKCLIHFGWFEFSPSQGQVEQLFIEADGATGQCLGQSRHRQYPAVDTPQALPFCRHLELNLEQDLTAHLSW